MSYSAMLVFQTGILVKCLNFCVLVNFYARVERTIKILFSCFFKPTLTSGDPIQSKCFSRLLFSFVEFSSNQPVVVCSTAAREVDASERHLQSHLADLKDNELESCESCGCCCVCVGAAKKL